MCSGKDAQACMDTRCSAQGTWVVRNGLRIAGSGKRRDNYRMGHAARAVPMWQSPCNKNAPGNATVLIPEVPLYGLATLDHAVDHRGFQSI